MNPEGQALADITIPFNRPSQTGREITYIQNVLESGRTAGDGPYGQACEKLLESEHTGMRALLTSSCSHAIEMAALLALNGEPGEVIVPSFTFATTASSFSRFGARLVFADIEPETLGLDPNSVERCLTRDTRAIVAVHYGGWGCQFEALQRLAEEAGATLIEDNAHALFGSARGRRLGTIGGLSATSFHATKNFSCGEGGALFVKDEGHYDLAVILREKGTNRRQFVEGRVDKYTWMAEGSSYLMSELQAACLLAQLEAREQILRRRRALCQRYLEGLRDWARAGGVRIPFFKESTGHIFPLLMPTNEQRVRLFEHLRTRGVQATSHYLPLHSSPMGLHKGRSHGCPVSDQVAATLLRLPVSASLTRGQVDQVLSAVLDFRP